MIDLVTGLSLDPVRLLTQTLVLLAGAVLLLGVLELLLFLLCSILLSWREGRSKAPPDLAVLIAVLALGAGFSLVSPRDLAAQDVPKIEARFTRMFSSDSLSIGDATLSPDGRWIAYGSLSLREGTGDIWVVSAEGGDPVRLTNVRHLNKEPQWFPSGDRIAFLSDQVAEGEGLLFYLMSIPFDPQTGHASGPARQVTLEPVREPAISPDGRWIAYGTYIREGKLRLIPSEGGVAHTLFDPDETTGSPRDPAWSSDSHQIYFTSDVPDSETTRLMRVSVEDGDAEVVSVIAGEVGPIGPDARYLVRLEPGQPQEGAVLELLDRDGRPLGQVPLHRNMLPSGPPGQPGFFSNGRGLMATVSDVVAPVFVAPLGGGPARRISEGRAYEVPLGWTPDSRKVFYETRVDGRETVLLSPLDGGPTPEIPLPEEKWSGSIVVPSADGEYLAYPLGLTADTGRMVMVRRISDGETRVMTHAFLRGLGGQVLGPGGRATDGNDYLYLERHRDRVELRASPPAGPSRVIREIAPGPGVGGRYSLGVHGDWVAYPESSGESGSTLFLSTGEGEPPRVLATVPGDLEMVCWSHDRRWIVAGHWVEQGQGFDFDLLLVQVTPEGRLASEPRILEVEAWIPLASLQWLPDNETIALFGMNMTPGGFGNRLWLIPTHEGGAAVPMALGGVATWYPSISPDGRYVAYEEGVELGGSSIWMLDYGEFLEEQGLLGG